MEQRKVSFEEGGIYLSTWGNPNILRHHIYYFEKKIPEEINKIKMLPTPSITPCPNFAAWIRLKSEFICNRLFFDFSRATGENLFQLIKRGKFEQILGKVETFFRNKNLLEKSKINLNELVKTFAFAIQLRNCIQHGGIPNVIRTIKGKYAKKFSISLNQINELLNPTKYHETKQFFLSAEQFLELLTKTTIIVKSGSLGKGK